MHTLRRFRPRPGQGYRRKADHDAACVPADMIRTSPWSPGAVNADLGCVNDDAFESHLLPDGCIRKFSLNRGLRLGHTLRISQRNDRQLLMSTASKSPRLSETRALRSQQRRCRPALRSEK